LAFIDHVLGPINFLPSLLRKGEVRIAQNWLLFRPRFVANTTIGALLKQSHVPETVGPISLLIGVKLVPIPRGRVLGQYVFKVDLVLIFVRN